jgi:putative DNA methylase
MSEFKIPKKLIEVALPLDAINVASAREKSIRHGHPSTLHLWWARRPLATARAVIFAQMVNDPGGERGYKSGVTREQANQERERLFDIMRRLVLWENTNNEEVLAEARTEILKSWQHTCQLNKGHPRASELFNPERLPAFHDPFAGGGALPLEAQRLGLESFATDLNPVAVTINKAMVEIPPKFSGRTPVGSVPEGETIKVTGQWPRATGLAEDVRRYGHWMREEAKKRVGHLYPQIEVTEEMVMERPDLATFLGQKLTVIAWLWARTVKSPNPAFSHVEVPLISTFVLSNKVGKKSYVKPVVDGDSYRFEVEVGSPPDDAADGTKAPGRGSNFRCIVSGTPIGGDYIKTQGQTGQMGARLMAIVAEGKRGRVYLAPNPEHEAASCRATPEWKPSGVIPSKLTGGTCVPYGLKEWGDLFTSRQLVVLTTFSALIQEVAQKCEEDAVDAGYGDDGVGLNDGGTGARAYAEAIAVYLTFALSRSADRGSTICSWDSSPKMEALRNTFGRQALPMTWDFAEGNPFSESSGNWLNNVEWVVKAIHSFSTYRPGHALQQDAQTAWVSEGSSDGGESFKFPRIVSTDPPYYDNIGYADLSDFFYVWLRKSLRSVFPGLYSTIAVPKAEELVAISHRHGGKEAAEAFFLSGMTDAMQRLANQAHPAFPVTIYYAFKQSETKEGTTSSTGWETFLEAVIRSGFALVGTWPVRTELANRMISSGTNALASSVVLVCQKRSANAQTISRKDFIRELRLVLPEALEAMTKGSGEAAPIAPVDLAQAAIGPGMAVFSKYASIIDGSGQPMSVKTALALINKEIDAFFNQGEGEMDADTRFCLDWFAQYGWKVGDFGIADTLARAKGTSVEGVRDSGILDAAGGKVRLLKPAEYSANWDPTTDERLPVWEGLHQLIRVFQKDGERPAAQLLRLLGTRQEAIRQLAYRLYTDCERKGWAEDARAYNDLIVAWEHIERALEQLKEESPTGQLSLF